MKLLSAAAAVLILIALLTWLSLRAFDTGAERFDQALGELDHFTATEDALLSNVLSARAGLLRNYDPLVSNTDALDVSLDRMREILTDNPGSEVAVGRLAASVSRQEELTEQFKSDNALLQNSLAYFSLFSSNMSAPDQGEPLAPAISALATAMLHLTLDTSAASARGVQDRLDELAKQVPSSVGTSPAVPLLAHARLLRELLPATDSILRALCASAIKHDEQALRSMLSARQLMSRTTAREYRLVLYLASLMLVGLLVYVGLKLRARSRALRRRAAFEHVLAGISMRFISARGPDLDQIVEQALAMMAQCVGGDRAYVVIAGTSKLAYSWCGPGLSFASGWPEQALSVLRRHHYPRVDNVVHVPRLARLWPGEAKDALVAAGLVGWASVTGRTACGAEVLLGFDAVTRPSRIMRTGELGLLRMALATIVNALDRRILEQERTRLESRLEQARRLETVGTLASGIAHNFNNIVGAILGYVEYADEQDGPSRVLDEIRKAGERARELVDQILTFARRHDAQRSSVDVHALTAEAMSLLRASLPPKIELVVRDTAESVVVIGVAAQLQQVILNLCNNAAEAMDHAGKVVLDVATIDLAAPRSLSHGTLGMGRYVGIAVSDTGRGMDQALFARIFEPFFTTRATGSGLGLATIRDIVREHGGAMHVQSAVGSGSRFEAWLPCVAAGTPGSNATLPFGQGEVVLIVEADAMRLMRDEEILAALGYEPVGYRGGADALAACEASQQRFDLILLADAASVGDMLGLSALLHRRVPDLPILLATSVPDEFNANELISAGVSDVVAWPITATDIAGVLRDWVGREVTRITRSTDIPAA